MPRHITLKYQKKEEIYWKKPEKYNSLPIGKQN